MAYLRKRGKNYFLCWRQNGKLREKKASSDYQTSQIILRDFEQRTDKENWGLPVTQKIGWQNFCQQFLDYSKTNKALNTYIRDSMTIKTFNYNLILREITDFTPQKIEEYKKIRLEAGLKKSSINRDLNTIKSMARRAFELGYLKNNPAKIVKKLPDVKSKKIRFLSTEEIARLLQTAKGSSTTYLSILISVYTGLRRSEVCFLTWDDIDFQNDHLKVNAKEGWHPKSYEMRTVPLHPTLKKYLMELEKKSKWVVCYENGEQLDPDVLTTMARKKFKQTGITEASFHTLRHTFASHLVLAGTDIFTISKLLGHADISTTTIYLHLRPQHLQDTIQKLPY